jgi:7,8-dihydropterin-6-yl-methyl-4-(beta-D-ribofuranosyl)aminobenzene 5'-phosphate synthase
MDFILSILLILSLSIPAWGKEMNMPVIKIYYDNTSVRKEIKPEWGFSALVKHKGRNILFDTGGNAEVLAANMKKMGSDPKYIEFIIISHEHWDHVNGLSVVLRPKQKVYLLKSFPEKLKEQVKASGAELIEVAQFQEIIPGVYTTGELGKGIKEQSLIVNTEKGLVIVTGCSHPGIVEIASYARKTLSKEIYFVVGGFHLYTHSADQIEGIINELKNLGVKNIAPCHCTGEKAIALFEEEYKKGFINVGAGSIIDTAGLN